MTERLRRWIQFGLVLGLIAGGVFATIWLVRTRPQPVRRELASNIPQVSVIAIAPRTFATPIIGHGTVRAKRQVQIVPELTGRLTYVHPNMAEGEFVKKGELLFEIDPRTYESHVKQVEADVRRLEIELDRHRDEKTMLERRLEGARKQLELADANVSRLTGLVQQQAGVTVVDVERAQSEQLRVQDAVLDLESKLALHPRLMDETDALLQARRAALDEARQNVERTRIYATFNARVDAVLAQESQVVVPAFRIATLTDMEAFEIATVLDPRDLQWTEHHAYARIIGQPDNEVTEEPQVRVTWTMFGQRLSWQGRVTRLERHDETTRTARVVVEVSNVEFEQVAEEGVAPRPGLSIGMFCRAEIPAEPLEDALVVPRHAMNDDHTVLVFVPDVEGRNNEGHLELRRVPMLRTVGDDVLVSFKGAEHTAALAPPDSPERQTDAPVCELKPDELLIVSPLPRPVPGMRLVQRELLAQAPRLQADLALATTAADSTLIAQARILLSPGGASATPAALDAER